MWTYPHNAPHPGDQVVPRTPDWDDPRALKKRVGLLGSMFGRRFRVETSDGYSDLWILPKYGRPKAQITSGMTTSELRAFIEGMMVGI